MRKGGGGARLQFGPANIDGKSIGRICGTGDLWRRRRRGGGSTPPPDRTETTSISHENASRLRTMQEQCPRQRAGKNGPFPFPAALQHNCCCYTSTFLLESPRFVLLCLSSSNCFQATWPILTLLKPITIATTYLRFPTFLSKHSPQDVNSFLTE